MSHLMYSEKIKKYIGDHASDMNSKKHDVANKMGYLNKERKTNADFMRKHKYEDVLAMRKSIGRKGKESLNIPKGEKNEGENMMFGKNNSQRA